MEKKIQPTLTCLLFLAQAFASNIPNCSAYVSNVKTEPLDLRVKRNHATDTPQISSSVSKISKGNESSQKELANTSKGESNTNKKSQHGCKPSCVASQVLRTNENLTDMQNCSPEPENDARVQNKSDVTQGSSADPINKIRSETTQDMTKVRFETTNPIQSVTSENKQLNDKRTDALPVNEPISSAQKPYKHVNRSDLYHVATETIANKPSMTSTQHDPEHNPQTHQSSLFIEYWGFSYFKREYELKIVNFSCENNPDSTISDITLLNNIFLRYKNITPVKLKNIHMYFASVIYQRVGDNLIDADNQKLEIFSNLATKQASIPVDDPIEVAEGQPSPSLLSETVDLPEQADSHNNRQQHYIRKTTFAGYKQFIVSAFFTLSGNTISFKATLKKILISMPELLIYLEQRLKTEIDQVSDSSTLKSDIDLEFDKLKAVLDAFSSFSQDVYNQNNESILEIKIQDLRKHILKCLSRKTTKTIKYDLYAFAIILEYGKTTHPRKDKNAFILFATVFNLENFTLNDNLKCQIHAGGIQNASNFFYSYILKVGENGPILFYNLELIARYLENTLSTTISNGSFYLLYLRKPIRYTLFYVGKTQKETRSVLLPSDFVMHYYERITDIIKNG